MTIAVDAVVYYKVTDAISAVTIVSNAHAATRMLAQGGLIITYKNLIV